MAGVGEDRAQRASQTGGRATAAEAAAPDALRYRNVLDQVAEGVVVADERGVEQYRNAAAKAMICDGPGAVLVEQALQEQLHAGRRGRTGERTLDLFVPTRRTLQLRCAPLQGPGGVLGAAVVVDDVTERRHLEAVRRDFVANVSHELKTPVGALSLLAETLDGEEDPEVVGRLAARVATEAERLSRIIDDLLDLSRIEAEERPGGELIDVAELLAGAVEPLRPLAVSAGIELRCGDRPPPLCVPGDRRDLVSAVTNLVDNAIKYSERGAMVAVAAVEEPGGVAITVADQGIGIPTRDLERIFERFYRVDRARSRSTGGTGLGLAIVRHVAANHGGSVTVDSAEGVGSTFVLHLPATAGPGVEVSGVA